MVLVTVASIFVYYLFSKSIYFQIFFSWSRQNIGLFVIVLFLLKILGIVWPPLPGGVFTLAAIPFIGWFPAYLVDFAGSTTVHHWLS